MRNYKTYSDKNLIDTIASGKEPEKSAAFSELYNRYSKKIFLYCRKVSNGESRGEDLFQDTFIKLLRSIENNVPINSVKGYLLKIARNHALNRKRQKKVETVEYDDLKYFFNDKTLETRELSEMLDSAMDLLSEEQKEAAILQLYYGLTYSEIANMTEVPLSTVRNRVVRAKIKLREILAPMLVEKN